MENVMHVADYIASRYQRDYGFQIDEMKLHKLMYFTQKESFIQNDEPLFEAVFYGWKYGPVLKEIRAVFMEKGDFPCTNPDLGAFGSGFQAIMDRVFSDYALKPSWSLSRLTHGEISWKRSREGIPDGESGNNPMDIEDIRRDATILKERRKALAALGVS